MFGNRFSRFHYLFVLVLAFVPTTLFAQGSDRGTLVGTVTDPSGAVVPGVKITVDNADTGASRSVDSGAVGYYSFPNLPVGDYAVKAEAEGFKQAVVENIRMEVGATFRADISLEVGELATQVTVEAASTPLLKTESAEVAHVVEQRRVVDLPLNGRDFQQLVLLTPGAVNVAGFQQASGLQGGANVLSTNPTLNVSNGGRPGTQLFLLDGADATNQHARTMLVAPNIDEIQEFRVSGSNFSAEYGYGTNVINVVTKGGTNEFHGGLWYFNRDDALKARDFFDPVVGNLTRNQFGGIIGGPIIKNRTFFSFTYEQQDQDQQTSTRRNVPTAQMRNGDLTELGKMIHDPLTSRLNEQGVPVRDPFANATIPQSRIHDSKTSPLPNSRAFGSQVRRALA